MIKLSLYNYGCGILNVEKELGIAEEIDDFLVKKIPELSLEATDALCDLEDSEILWFSANDEVTCVKKIKDVLKSQISSQSQMQFTVEIDNWF